MGLTVWNSPGTLINRICDIFMLLKCAQRAQEECLPLNFSVTNLEQRCQWGWKDFNDDSPVEQSGMWTGRGKDIFWLSGACAIVWVLQVSGVQTEGSKCSPAWASHLLMDVFAYVYIFLFYIFIHVYVLLCTSSSCLLPTEFLPHLNSVPTFSLSPATAS